MVKKVSKEKIAVELKDRWAMRRKDLVRDTNAIGRKPIDIDRLKAIVDSNADKINDSKGIKELLPDIALAEEILIASVLSPKDLTDVSLNIGIDKAAPPEIAEIVRKHMSSVYNIDAAMGSILGEALVSVGSYSLLTIPTKVISNMIQDNNVAVEGVEDNEYPNKGLVYTKSQYAMETISSHVTGGTPDLLTITDNISYLAKPEITAAYERTRLSAMLSSSFGIEGIADTNEIDVYLKRVAVPTERQELNDLDKAVSPFNPIVIKVPAESVIPVFKPGDPSDHVGYFIVLDDNGQPVSRARDVNHFKDLNNRLSDALRSKENGIITSSLGGSHDTKGESEFLQPIIDSYIVRVESELKASVEKGLYGKSVEVSNPDEIYRIMLMRQLHNQKTKVLYIPATMLTYIAFDYNEMGTGVGLIEKTKLYASLRAILMFARIMAGVKNSVSNRVLNITLDEHDNDPTATVETIITEYTALQNTALPLGRLRPADLVDSLQQAGVSIKVEGGNLFPNTSMEVEETTRDVNPPDTDLEDTLLRLHYAGLMVTPEQIDNSLEGKFATGITANNLLMSKRVNLIQKEYIKHLSKFIRQYIRSGGPLQTAIRKLANEQDDGIGLDAIVDSITVILPKSDNAVIKIQYEAFQDYSDFIEEAVELYYSEDILDSMVQGDIVGDGVANVKSAMIAYMKRQYMVEMNMLPALHTAFNDTDANIADTLKAHNKTVTTMTEDIYRAIIKVEAKEDSKSEKVLSKIEENKTNGSGDGEDTGDTGGAQDDGDGFEGEIPAEGDTGDGEGSPAGATPDATDTPNPDAEPADVPTDKPEEPTKEVPEENK